MHKREAYRLVFHGFDIDACVAMSDEELEGLLLHEGIIRNRNKVFSVRSNAQVVQKIREEFSSFDAYIWSFTNGKQIDGHGKALEEFPTVSDVSRKMVADMKKRGISFVGPVITYSFLQALDAMKENPEGLIFYDHNKDSLAETTQVNCFFKRICQKADIPVTGQHALRHTFATRCIEAGVSPLVLKNWLGHTNIHITLDTYADVFARMNAGVVSLLEQHIEAISPVMLPAGNENEEV